MIDTRLNLQRLFAQDLDFDFFVFLLMIASFDPLSEEPESR